MLEKIVKLPFVKLVKTTKTFNTTNLVHHLKVKHTNMYATYKKSDDDLKEASKGKECASSKSVQLSFDESIERTKKWDIKDPRARNIHRKIGEMIALDCHHFPIVDDVGFSCLLHSVEPRYNIPSRKYITEKVLPSIYDDVKATVTKQIAGVKHISFTTDIWSTNVCTYSLLSLTSH